MFAVVFRVYAMKSSFKALPFYLCSVFVMVLLLAAFHVAHATTLNFRDVFDPNPDPLISFGNNQSYSFTHSIIADQDGPGGISSGVYGYNPLTDTITSVSIELLFKDESADVATESVQLIFDEQSLGTRIITSGGAVFSTILTSGFETLVADGILEIELQNVGMTNGHQDLRSNFLFMESILEVVASNHVDNRMTRIQSIPEPPILLLLGTMLLGMIISRGMYRDNKKTASTSRNALSCFSTCS